MVTKSVIKIGTANVVVIEAKFTRSSNLGVTDEKYCPLGTNDALVIDALEMAAIFLAIRANVRVNFN